MLGSDTLLALTNGAEKNKKRRTGEILQRIYDGAHPPSLFIEKARTLHHELRLGAPPIDPWEIARRLNIEVKERSMALDGYLERAEDETYVIFVRREATPARKRFTICHEIAHTFFFDILSGQRKYRQGSQDDSRQQDDPEEEWLCDIAAAELLMPFSFFNGDVKAAQHSGGLTPSGVLKLMGRYQASLQAVAARITWVSRNTMCALWERKGPAVNLVWAAPSKARSLVLCQTGKSSIETASATPSRQEITANDSFYMLDEGTHLIRRQTSSRRLRSGQILSVLTPPLSSSNSSKVSGSCTPRDQLTFAFD
jgi:Zn-dependent peptidase ImmA (M78 family)